MLENEALRQDANTNGGRAVWAIGRRGRDRLIFKPVPIQAPVRGIGGLTRPACQGTLLAREFHQRDHLDASGGQAGITAQRRQ